MRYVPDHKQNLISLGIFDVEDYRVKVESGILEVTRGSMVVLTGFRMNEGGR